MNLSKEHYNCAFSLGSFLFCSPCISLGICFLHQQHGVHSPSGKRTKSCWARGGGSLTHSLCGDVVQSTSSQFVGFCFKAFKSWLWPCSILSKHDIDRRCYRSPCILSRPNCTPEASYLIRSWFHWGGGGVECKKNNNKTKKERNLKHKRSLFLNFHLVRCIVAIWIKKTFTWCAEQCVNW